MRSGTGPQPAPIRDWLRAKEKASCPPTRSAGRLVAHECVHTGQYERMGGIKPFLKAYLRECIDPGYPNGPLEREAIERSRRVVG